MPTSNRSISAYLGALVLSAGLASPIALADEPVKEDPVASEKTTDKSKDAGASKGSSTGVNKADSRDEADLIEVRVSLPDGRTFTRLEPRRKLSARYSRPGSIPGRLSRPGSGGSDVSVAARGVRGGSNSSSIRTGSGGGGGGASSSGGGGGGGSAGSGGGASSSTSAALSQSGSSAGKGVFTYGSGEASTAASTTGASSSGSKAGGGVTTYGSGSSSGTAGSSSEGTGSTSSSSGSTSSSGTSSSGGGVFDYGTGSTSSGGSSGGQSNSGSGGSSQGSDAGSPSVPSIGEPTFDTQGNATGGQSVVFEDAGMSAAVIGSRIYFNNVELVVADEPFEVITGTRLEHSSAMMESGRLSSDHRDVLSSFNTGSSSMKLEFEPDTVVTLMMYNPSQNVLSPAREMRTWTVRIR